MDLATKRWRKALRNAYRGYELLTETHPTIYDDTLGRIRWQDVINTDHLDIADEFDCVLGQIFGDYSHGAHELGLQYSRWRRFALGFNAALDGNVPDCDMLTDAWMYLLKTRS